MQQSSILQLPRVQWPLAAPLGICAYYQCIWFTQTTQVGIQITPKWLLGDWSTEPSVHMIVNRIGTKWHCAVFYKEQLPFGYTIIIQWSWFSYQCMLTYVYQFKRTYNHTKVIAVVAEKVIFVNHYLAKLCSTKYIKFVPVLHSAVLICYLISLQLILSIYRNISTMLLWNIITLTIICERVIQILVVFV